MIRNSRLTQDCIELVVVIVILGILAATAAPKFMNLQSDARISALNGLKASVKSASAMIYSKAILAGKEKATADEAKKVCANGPESTATSTCTDEITIAYGYPTADAAGIIATLQDGAAACTSFTCAEGTDYDWGYDTKDSVLYIFSVNAPDKEHCAIKYTAPTTLNGTPKIETASSGC